jgi:hypothetical protein
LSASQREQLLNPIALYVGAMDDGHARVKMAEVRAHLDRTWFARIGRTDPGSVFYYRVHSPVVLIEFDQKPIGTAISWIRTRRRFSTSTPSCGRRTATTTARTCCQHHQTHSHPSDP